MQYDIGPSMCNHSTRNAQLKSWGLINTCLDYPETKLMQLFTRATTRELALLKKRLKKPHTHKQHYKTKPNTQHHHTVNQPTTHVNLAHK